MENRGPVQQTENERRCQIEGCNDVTVGARTSLCRKHRNNKYKQNYKKKKRKAQGTEENQGESLESQLAVEKYHLEQKYASMLQQVLVQKRLELLQSPSICNLLRIHQQNVRENKQKELLERRKAAQNERNSKMQQEKQSKSLSAPNSSTSCSSTTCNSGTTTKSPNGSSKSASSSKTLVKSSKQSSRPPQGRTSSKNSKNRNNSNSSIESTVNGLMPHSKITSNGSESVGHPMYASSGIWDITEEKAEFSNLRQVQNFQQQQITPQQMLLNPTQQALHPQKQEQQQNASHNMPVQLLQHYQQHNMPKEQFQYLQHQKLLEQVHQKQLHEKKQQQLQQQHLQQPQRLQEQQLVQQQQQQQQQLSQQRRLQQQRQQELHIQLQSSRQQQLQQQQQQQRQHLQGSGHQNQQHVQFHQQQEQPQQQQHQSCTSSVSSSVKNISGTELSLQSLPSIQSSMSSLLVSQSHINTSRHDCISTSGILTTRHSVLPRTVLTNTQGNTQSCIPINHMVSNTSSSTSHRPIAPRLEGHPSINNALCNGGMPIITAIISAPLTQQIVPQSAPNVERNSLHVVTEANALNPMNSSGNALSNHYPLMPFNIPMDMNLLQGFGAQFSEQNVQCATTQVRGRQMLLD